MMNKYVILLFSVVTIGALLNVGCEQPANIGISHVLTGSTEVHKTVEITNANFDELVLNSKTPVLIDFWAPWCGPCLALTPTIEELAAEYDGQLVVGKVNLDEQQELGSRYNIDSIPALLYFKNGEVVKDSLGLKSHNELKSEIDAVLNL